MDFDFHYYGTYCASRQAGYNDEEAKVIASSAQFVDDYTKKDFDGIENARYTAFKFSTRGFLEQGTSTDKELAKIWIPFHFPPRLSTEQAISIGTEAYLAKPTIEEGDLKYVTAPMGRVFSNLVTLDDANDLFSIGLKMHVLADSYAHQGYVGYRRNGINCIKGKMTTKIGDETNSSQTNCFTPLYAVGHIDSKHMPDTGYVKSKYTPYWSEGDKPVTRNNPKIYAMAYITMLIALDNKRNPNNSVLTDEIVTQIHTEILELMREVPHDENGEICPFQERNWLEYIARNNYMNPEPHLTIKERVERDKNGVIDFFKYNINAIRAFNNSAINHYNMVNELLNRELNNFPRWK